MTNNHTFSRAASIALAFGLALIVIAGAYLALINWFKPAESSVSAANKPPLIGLQQPLNPANQGSQANISAGDPTFPIRAAFYYPWYPEAWSQSGYDPFTNYQPILKYYDSSDLNVIRKHIEDMQYGNINAGIASWWGQASPTDKRFPLLLQAAGGTNFRWTIYYEMAATQNPTADQLKSDLIYIRDHYAQNANYLRIGGRFVVFIYNTAANGCAIVQNWQQANNGIGAYLVMKVFSNYRACPAQPDAWHQYAPSNPTDVQGKNSFTISPGYWKKGETAKLPRDLARWAQNVSDMVTSNAEFQLITSFNEWGEGTAVEPASDWQSASGYGAYLDILHANGAIGSVAKAQFTLPAPTQNSAAASQASVVPTQPAQPGAATPSPIAPTQNTPALSTNGDPILLAAGDISSCTNPGDYATAKIIEQFPGAAVASLGDTVYEQGTAAQFAQCFDPSWGVFKYRIHPAVGNHEYLTPEASGYFDYFGAQAGQPGQGYYSYNLGAWHVIVINSNCDKVGGCGTQSPQGQWLQADLAANPTKCTLAYWHHPRFSSGEHGDQTQMSAVWDILYKAGVDLVLNGHDHDYERFQPLDASGNPDPTNGIREFVVGTGGKNYYAFNTIEANSAAHVANVFGVLKLNLHPTGYDWQFLPEPGKTFIDTGTGTCH